VFGQNKTILF